MHPIATLVSVVLLSISPATMAGDDTPAVPDWTQWRGPDRNGIAAETTWRSEIADTPLWEINVGLGYSSVCLTGGRLITHGFDEASSEDVIVCLDPLTGAEHWRHSYPAEKGDTMHDGGTLTSPVADGDNVYVLSRMGALRCLDRESGTVRWSRVIDAEFEVTRGTFGLPSSPLVLEEGLAINVGKTIMLDKQTGTTIWQTGDYGYSYSVPVDFTLGDRPALAVFNKAGLVTLDRASGTEIHSFPWPSQFNVNSAAPIAIGSRVFISTGYGDKGSAMLDLSGDEVEIVWQSKVMKNKMTGSVLMGDHLYGFDHAILKCIDLDGNEQWRKRGLGTGAFLATTDGRLIVLSEKGELVVAQASPRGFEELSRKRIFARGNCWTSPVLAGGLIYCRNSAGDLVCLDQRSTDP